jgi:hypothetical protein
MYRRFLFGSRGEDDWTIAARKNYFKISLKKICEKQMDLLLPGDGTTRRFSEKGTTGREASTSGR